MDHFENKTWRDPLSQQFQNSPRAPDWSSTIYTSMTNTKEYHQKAWFPLFIYRFKTKDL